MFRKGELVKMVDWSRIPKKDHKKVRYNLNMYENMHNKLDWKKDVKVPQYVSSPIITLKFEGTITPQQLLRMQVWAKKTLEYQKGKLTKCTMTFTCGMTKRTGRKFIVHKGRRIYL